MMKEDINIEEKELLEVKNHLSKVFDIIRGSINGSDYHFVLYLLTLQRYEVFKGKSFEDHLELYDLIGDSNEILPKELEKVRESYFLQLDNLDINIIKDVIKLYCSIDQLILQKHFPEIFDDLLYKSLKYNGRISSELVLSEEINRLVGSLMDLKVNYQESELNQNLNIVYNPFAGHGSFRIYSKRGDDLIFYQQELNHTKWLIGTLRLIAYEKTSLFLEEDSIEEWKKAFIDRAGSQHHETTKFQLVVSSPPIGMKLPNLIGGKFGIIKTYEHFLIEKGIDSLNNNGSLIAVISPSFLSRSGSEESLRKYLIDNDLLEMVISLPGGILFNTEIPLVIIVINKCKKKNEKGIVKFIDAKNFIEKTPERGKKLVADSILTNIISENESDSLRFIQNGKIILNRYNLDQGRYFLKTYNGIQLKDLGQIISSRIGAETYIGKYIRIRDLRDNVLDYQLSLDNIEDSDIPRQAQKIVQSCLLIATRWKTLKPTYFKYEGSPIYISPDTIAFKVDEIKCDIPYLINELHSSNVLEQIDSYRTGNVIPSIKKDDLLSVFISIPEIGQQKEVVKQRLFSLAEEKKKELILFNKIHGLEVEIFEQNTFLRHTLAGPASNLRDSVTNIRTILINNLIPLYPNLLDLKISEKHLKSLGDYISIIERDAEKIVQTVSSQLKVDTGINTKKLIQIEIIEFLENYSIEYNERGGLDFEIIFLVNETDFFNIHGERIKTFILGNDDILRDLFDNLVNNAIKHAFTPGDNNQIRINIQMADDFEDKYQLAVVFSNTGKPFPKNFSKDDFIRKGAKNGINAGDGVGGWYINEIIERLKGDFDLVDETGDDALYPPNTNLSTSLVIYLPIIEIEENE